MDVELAYSFDDVLLVPRKSSILPSEADITSRLTEKIPLNIPIISSPMDTVTEDKLAIALAREGGLGVIHRNCTLDEQADYVARVKRSENMVIPDPFTVSGKMSIRQLETVMADKGVSGFPVVDGEKKLVGMVTTRDIWYIEDAEKTTVADVMTPRDRLVTSNANTTLEEARSILYKNRIEKLPLVDQDNRLVGLITSQDIEKRQMYTTATKDANGRLMVGAAIGTGPQALERAEALIQAGTDILFIDAATGHTTRVADLLKHLRKVYEVPVVAGNVVTQEGALDLIRAGASAIKVGVGPGSICTTRVIAGVGVPQFSAILDVSKAAKDAGIPIIADGGIRFSGDIVKAIAAGADCVMLGSILAGTRESPGNTVQYQGRTYKEYRGMGSLKAMRKGSGDRYGQNSSGKLVAEGVEARVPYRGRLEEVVFQLLGGLRSGMGYVGAHNLDELRTEPKFVRITPGGLRESHPHDITITEEPVNYQSTQQ